MVARAAGFRSGRGWWSDDAGEKDYGVVVWAWSSSEIQGEVKASGARI